MCDHFYTISATLEVKTPLHVGNGEFRRIGVVKGDGNDGPPQVAAIQRDAKGRPYVPGTTWKGFFLNLWRSHHGSGMDLEKELFGNISDHDTGTGSMGAVRFTGTSIEDLADSREMPYAVLEAEFDRPAAQSQRQLLDRELLGNGVFVAGRTRIDTATGTADDGKLFFQEMVAPGARIQLSFRLAGSQNAAASPCRLSAFLALFRQLETCERSLGKGSGAGLGSLAMVPGTLHANRHRLTDALVWETETAIDSTPDTLPQDRTAVQTETLSLVCPGPFMVVDSSQAAKGTEAKGTKASSEEERKKIMASRISDKLPLLMGPSLKGAARSRVGWLFALDQHRKAVDDGRTLDRSMVDNPDKVLKAGSKPDSLTPVERLFGVTGFKGLLEISSISVSEAQTWDVTSVKLDRFSGGPVDGALFTSATFVGTRLSFRLSLRKREKTEPDQQDVALFQSLISDIRKNGLMLGHGTNKGLGWFENGDNS